MASAAHRLARFGWPSSTSRSRRLPRDHMVQQPRSGERLPAPNVAAEVPDTPGAYDRIHEVSRELLRECVVSEDPELARDAITRRQIDAYLDEDDLFLHDEEEAS